MLSEEVTFSSPYHNAQVYARMANESASRGWWDPAAEHLDGLCFSYAATVDFSTCRYDWPACLFFLLVGGGALKTQGLRIEVNVRLLLNVDQVGVVRVTLMCFVSLSTMLDCLKRTTCRNGTVSKADFWYQTSLTTASCFPWLDLKRCN